MAFIEVKQAIKFLRDFLGRNEVIHNEKIDKFCNRLERLLVEKYKDHWHPQRPHKGSAFRCLRLSDRHMDPVLATAAKESGVSRYELACTLPTELTVWIDPFDVSYRIGEEGSICQLFEAPKDETIEGSKTSMASVTPAPCRVESNSSKNFENSNDKLQECLSG